MENEKLEQRHKDILMFIRIVRLLDFQYPAFLTGLKHEHKMRLNTFRANLNAFQNILKTNLPPEYDEQLDNDAAGAWDVLYEYSQADDKAMFLAICQAYNAGGIQAETTGEAVNSPEFIETLKPKAA